MKYFKTIALFFTLFASLFCFELFAKESLVGKKICLDYRNQDIISSFLFNSDAYNKKNFSKKNIFYKPIIGEPITIIDEYFYKKGEEYKEAYCYAFDYNGQKGVLYFPLYVKAEDLSLDAMSVYNAREKHFEKMSKGRYYHFTPEDILLQYIDCSEIETFEKKHLNQFVYPIQEATQIKEQKMDEEKYYETYGNQILFLYQKYKFIGFEFITQKGKNGKDYNCFYANFQKDGKLINYPLRPIGNQNSVTVFLADLGKYIVLEDEYKDYCKSLNDTAHINSIVEKFINKEVVIAYASTLAGAYYIKNFDADSPNGNDAGTKMDGTFYVEGFKLMPSIKKNEPLQYCAILSNSSKTLFYALPIAGLEKYGELKADKDKRIQDQENKRAQALAEKNKANEERHKRLVQSYGKTNGDCVFYGEVKIGFSKEMCREAWGNPSSIDTTTTKAGKREFWYYGDGQYLIFEGNKLVLIHESE